MKTIFKKITGIVLISCMIVGLFAINSPIASAVDAIVEKPLKYFDEEIWSDYSVTGGNTLNCTLPDGISSLYVNNVSNAGVERKNAVFGNSEEDSSLHIYAKNHTNSRTLAANLYEATDAASLPDNVEKNDIFTLYTDLLVDVIPAATTSFGMNVCGRRDNDGTGLRNWDIFNLTNDGDGTYSITVNGNAPQDFSIEKWINVAVQITFVENNQMKCDVYINGEKIGTSTQRQLNGISYVRFGYQQASSAQTTAPSFYINNVGFYKEGFNVARYKAIRAASAITVESIKGANASLDNLTANLSLYNVASNGSQIEWTTSNTNLISNNGTVKPSAIEATDVTLIATVKNEDKSVTKTYKTTVPYDENGYSGAQPITDKGLDCFDGAGWMLDQSVTTGTYTKQFDYPASMSLYYNNVQISNAEKALGALGKDDLDASLHLYTSGAADGTREFGANLFAAADADAIPDNVVRGDKFAIYSEIAADGIPENIDYMGMRIVGKKDSAGTSSRTWDIFNFVNEGGNYRIAAGENSMPYTPGTWVSVVNEIEFVTNSTVVLKTYVNGTLLGASAPQQLYGISYLRMGFQKSTSVSEDASLYIDNVAFTANQGFDINRYKAIRDASALTSGYIKGSNSSLDNVTSNIYLPRIMREGSTIAWSSSNRNIVSNEGEVHPSFIRDCSVTLTATLTNGNVSVAKNFGVNVKKIDINAPEIEDPTFFKDGFKNNTHKFSDEYSSSVLPFTYAECDGVYQIYNNFMYEDLSGLGSSSATGKPYIVYELDEAITGFEVDTFFYNKNGEYTGDFDFFVSADGERWINVEDYVTVSDKNEAYNASTGYAQCKYTALFDDFSNHYLKIVWGSAGNVKHRYRSSIDTVKIFYPNEVQLASRDFTFDRVSSQPINAVTRNLNLVTSGDGGTTIFWQSSNEAVISSSGIVNTDAFEGYGKTVTLTATFSKDSLQSIQKEFEVTVVKDVSSWSDMDFVNFDIDNLTFESFCEQPQSQLVGKVKLPVMSQSGTVFTWSSSDMNIAAVNNADAIVEFIPNDYKVGEAVLSVTAQRGSAKRIKTFDVGVIRSYGKNLIKATAISSSSATETIRNTQSRELVSYWESDVSDNQKSVTVRFDSPTTISAGLLVEKGNNVSGYTVKISNDNYLWKTVYTGTALGDCVRLPFTFEAQKCKYVQISFESSSPVGIYTLELYNNLATPEKQAQDSLDSIVLPAVTSTNITLPTQGLYGGTIVWSTNNAEVITENGVITRVVNKNRTATLTATLTLGSVVVTKNFTITVAAKLDLGGGADSSGGFGGSGGSGVVLPQIGMGANTQIGDSQTTGFRDVPTNHWAYSYISDLLKAGIISADENYRPEDNITREEVLKLLLLSIGENISESECSFDDVDRSAWYYRYVSAAVNNEIVYGMGDGSFGIGKAISRQDLAVMVNRVLMKKGITAPETSVAYSDKDSISDYAREAVRSMAYFEIMIGFENNSFCPEGITTRAQCAKIMSVLRTLISKEAK